MNEKQNSKRFTLSFGKKDSEAQEWFCAQTNGGAYLKALILADMQAPIKEEPPKTEGYPFAENTDGQKQQFSIRFNQREAAAEAWFFMQPDKGAYLKRLILADKARQQNGVVLQPLNAHDAAWEERYELVLEFLDRFGRLPYAYEEFRGVKLGRWLEVHTKRDAGRPDRMEKLARIGALDKWERFYRLLESFVKENGRLPGKKEIYADVSLGAWLTRQRADMRSEDSKLSKEQEDKLRLLGVSDSDWESKFGLVLSFCEEHGRLPKFEDTYHGVNIGRWIYAQRKTLDPTRDAQRVAKLHSIGAIPFVRQKNVKRASKVKAE